MENFTVGMLFGGSGIRKQRGARPLAVFTALFALPFVEAMSNSTGHLETMVKRVLALGIRADFLLMDSFRLSRHPGNSG